MYVKNHRGSEHPVIKFRSVLRIGFFFQKKLFCLRKKLGYRRFRWKGTENFFVRVGIRTCSGPEYFSLPV